MELNSAKGYLMSPHPTAPQHKKRSGLASWLLIGAVVIVAVIAVVVGADLMIKSQGPTPGVAADRTAGDPQAPIAFVEFSDFQ
jgi:hypothetical protein